MSDKTLNLALSGREIMEVILDKIREKMQRDCFLSPMTAYQKFDAHVTISVKAHDCGRLAESNFDVIVEQGEVPPEHTDDDQYLEAAETQFDISATNPNETRLDAGLPIPTLKSTDGKKEIVPVRYQRKGKGAKELK